MKIQLYARGVSAGGKAELQGASSRALAGFARRSLLLGASEAAPTGHCLGALPRGLLVALTPLSHFPFPLRLLQGDIFVRFRFQFCDVR